MDTARGHDSRYSWMRLAITLVIAATGNVGMWSIIVMMPGIEAEFGTGRAAASLPYTAAMAGFAVGSLIIGRAVDRWGITPALIWAGLLISGGFALAAVSPSLELLLIVQMALGFGAAVSFGPLIADISHWFLRRRGIAVALAASGNYLSGAIWPLLLAPVLETYGWRGMSASLAVICLVVMLPLALALRPRIADSETDRAAAAAAANARGIALSQGMLRIMLVIAGIACCVAMSMPQVHIVSLSVDRGHGTAAGAEMLSLMLLGGVVSRIVSGLLADRLGGVRTLLIGSVLQCLALFLFLPAGGATALYAVSLVFGLAQGGIVPSYAIIVREYMPPKEAGTWVGLCVFATIVGMAFGGWLSGWLYDQTGSYTAAIVNGIGWNFLNIALVSLILMRSGRGRTLAA